MFSKARDLSRAMLAYTELPDELRALEPPDPIPNSAVKRRIADGSVVFRHVRVGHRQAFISKKSSSERMGFFLKKYLLSHSHMGSHVK